MGPWVLPRCCHGTSRDLGLRRPSSPSQVWKLCMYFGCNEEREALAWVGRLACGVTLHKLHFLLLTGLFSHLGEFCWYSRRKLKRDLCVLFLLVLLYSGLLITTKKGDLESPSVSYNGGFQSWALRCAFSWFQEKGQEGMLGIVQKFTYFCLPLGESLLGDTELLWWR